jgi:YfiR/HmsC-like
MRFLQLLQRLKYIMFNKYTFVNCMILALISTMFPISQAAPAAQEYQIKAVFLFNFVSFITWPANSFKQESDPFRVCIFGEDPFGTVLDLTIENHTVEGREMKILRLKDLPTIRNCQILFISDSEQARQKDILKTIRALPILSVGDSENFIQQGGMIKFFSHNNKIRLGVNPDALETVGLKANANLLNLAIIERATGAGK